MCFLNYSKKKKFVFFFLKNNRAWYDVKVLQCNQMKKVRESERVIIYCLKTTHSRRKKKKEISFNLRLTPRVSCFRDIIETLTPPQPRSFLVSNRMGALQFS
jgi:hypothetical protein